jgi:hypothetical protein
MNSFFITTSTDGKQACQKIVMQWLHCSICQAQKREVIAWNTENKSRHTLLTWLLPNHREHPWFAAIAGTATVTLNSSAGTLTTAAAAASSCLFAITNAQAHDPMPRAATINISATMRNAFLVILLRTPSCLPLLPPPLLLPLAPDRLLDPVLPLLRELLLFDALLFPADATVLGKLCLLALLLCVC